MREKLLFNDGWKICFTKQLEPIPTNKGGAYLGAKTERAQWGYASNNYDETVWGNHDNWVDVTLPNDYIITQTPDKTKNEAWGYFDYHSACYKKRFILNSEDNNKRITLYFEGIATSCVIYVNGCLMTRNYSAYTPIEVDISDIANYGAENTVYIFVDSTPTEGWWYGGGGIYRDVWLCKTALVNVDLYGIFANPQKTSETQWNVTVEITIRNDDIYHQKVNIVSDIIYNDLVVGTAKTIAAIRCKGKHTVKKVIQITNPRLWDIESPFLYKLNARILKDEKLIDMTDVHFGFRTAEFHKDFGFLLNGKQVKIKGVCCHEDYGITGRVVPDTVKELRLRKIKEMGANGYRTAHYPHSDVTMNLLDRMGFLVLCETRWFESTPEGLHQLEVMIKNNRNHPGIILWCIGNEEFLHTCDKGKRISESMIATIKRLDNGRPITNAVDKSVDTAPVHTVMDVIGVNYNIQMLEKTRESFPNKPLVSSENCACGSTRGWYFADDPTKGYLKSYDAATYAFANTRRSTWQIISTNDWIAGGYQWAGIEHRGETVWPRLCSQSGALDLFLQKKDGYYQNIAHWTNAPMVHILPHWNHNGREGDIIDVWVYTNCHEVELFQDGISKGKQVIEPCGHAMYQLTYSNGTIRADGWREDRIIASETIETTNIQQKLVLTLETPNLTANGRDVAVITCYCVDDKGRFVPDADPMVEFTASEYGEIIGTGSDVSDHIPVNSCTRKMYAGLCSVAVRAGTSSGILKVYVKADNLEGGYLEIKLV
ncbi:MAG: DUF4982 domain-containing protein [Firmicutes bacterium]|nr:DUF4982 domain-containing protein [Bacillota bacterium]